jgi:beta-glucosidase
MTWTWPDGFWWGTGNSSNQCEGAAPASDWLLWEQAGRAPASGTGSDFATRYDEDFRLLREIGLEHFRLSVEWARLEPAEGRYDRAEIERYRTMLQQARDQGINIWVTAHHFTLPAWVSERGSFLDDDIRMRVWPRHIDFLAETFGDLVFGWKPINEPSAYAACGWLGLGFPPGHRDVSEYLHALQATHLANFEAGRRLRGGGQPVATIHNLTPSFPASDAPADQTAAAAFDELNFGCWIRATTDGVFRLPEMPGRDVPEPVTGDHFADAFDVIGFSYYGAASVATDHDGGDGMKVGIYPPDATPGILGNAYWPDGLKVTLDRLHRDLPGRPLLVSEYGIGTFDDADRQRYLRDGVRLARQAVVDGVDLVGFFHWTGIDNYEWLLGWDAPFGLIDRDRNPRASAALMQFYAEGGEPGREPEPFR